MAFIKWELFLDKIRKWAVYDKLELYFNWMKLKNAFIEGTTSTIREGT
jgi:hypothetical protein